MIRIVLDIFQFTLIIYFMITIDKKNKLINCLIRDNIILAKNNLKLKSKQNNTIFSDN